MPPAAPPPRSRTAGFTLPLNVAHALPWFTAEGERAWAPGWDPQLISGDGSRGSVFRTRNDQGLVTTWIVLEYGVHAGIGRAAYARVAGDAHAGLVEVECRGSGVDACAVMVTYTLSPLAAPDADAQLERFFAGYDVMIGEWHERIVAAMVRAASSADTLTA